MLTLQCLGSVFLSAISMFTGEFVVTWEVQELPCFTQPEHPSVTRRWAESTGVDGCPLCCLSTNGQCKLGCPSLANEWAGSEPGWEEGAVIWQQPLEDASHLLLLRSQAGVSIQNQLQLVLQIKVLKTWLYTLILHLAGVWETPLAPLDGGTLNPTC